MTGLELAAVLGIAALSVAALFGIYYVILCFDVFHPNMKPDSVIYLRHLIGQSFILLLVSGLFAVALPILIAKMHP